MWGLERTQHTIAHHHAVAGMLTRPRPNIPNQQPIMLMEVRRHAPENFETSKPADYGRLLCRFSSRIYIVRQCGCNVRLTYRKFSCFSQCHEWLFRNHVSQLSTTRCDRYEHHKCENGSSNHIHL